MRTFIFLSLACCLIPAVIAEPPESSKPGMVTGHVYCVDTNRPCRFAEVNIHRVQAEFEVNKTGGNTLIPDRNTYSATTGIDGAFLITGVPPGDYYVRSHFAGYLDPFQVVFSESESEETIPPEELEKVLPRIKVSAGMTTTSDLTLSRGASLEGTVRYDDGAPAGFVNFRLYRRSKTGNWNRFGDSLVAGYRMTSFARTDDRGRFYFPGLPAGFYIVEVSLPQTRIIPGIGAGFASDGEDSLRVFNGDKYRMKEAPPIELKDGEERQGVDIVIPTNGLLTLQGAVVAKTDGHPISKGTISLLDPDDKSILREADIQKDGSFSFNYVTSGNYIVQVEAQANAGELPYDFLSIPLHVGNDMSDLTFAVPTKKH